MPAACHLVLTGFAISAGRVRPKRYSEGLVAH